MFHKLISLFVKSINCKISLVVYSQKLISNLGIPSMFSNSHKVAEMDPGIQDFFYFPNFSCQSLSFSSLTFLQGWPL